MRYLLLQVWSNREEFILRDIRRQLERMGHEVGIVCIAKDRNTMQSKMVVHDEVQKFNPHRIIWLATVGFHYQDVWDRLEYLDVPRFALFYDDPVHRIKDQRLEGLMRMVAVNGYNTYVGVWDGYWREQLFNLYGLQSHEIHLSADAEEFNPSDNNMLPDKYIFVGMLHSQNAINRKFEKLSKPLQFIVKDIDSIVSQLVHEKVRHTDYVVFENGESLIQSYGDVFERYNDAEMVGFRWVVWALLKNASRIMMLRQIQRDRLAIFSEMMELDHANEDELRLLLKDPDKRIVIVNTSNWSAEQLGEVYSSGLLHIQATDPQSVYGGIPYRMFQSAACGRALLTDSRPELAKAFKRDEEVLIYGTGLNDNFFSRSMRVIEMDLKDVGQRARKRFIQEHTWEHRVLALEGLTVGMDIGKEYETMKQTI